MTINRVTKVVKGGRRLRFCFLRRSVIRIITLVLVLVKLEVPANPKLRRCKEKLIEVPLTGTTIPHEAIGEFCGGRVS